jgi:nucleoside-diphosphate-sugar epimerase
MDGDVSIDPPDRAAHLLEDRLPPHDLGVAGFVPPQARSEGTSMHISHAKATRELGWTPAMPTYREGIRALTS